MQQVLSKAEASFREKGSKFIGYLFPAENQAIFDNELGELKAEYADATHHCYAWRLHPAGIKEFAQDDGEPGGSAGLPILNQLKSFEVVNAGLVVVRYYGGTNLGKSGLIKAYGNAATLSLQKASLKPIQLIWKLKIEYPYAEQNTVEKLMHRFNLKELQSTYTENVSLLLACPAPHKQKIANRLQQLEHLGIKADFLEKSYL